jgi:hypothetical protein
MGDRSDLVVLGKPAATTQFDLVIKSESNSYEIRNERSCFIGDIDHLPLRFCLS